MKLQTIIISVLILVLVVICVLGIYSIAYEKGVTKQLRKELNTKAEETAEEIGLKDNEIWDLWSNIRERNTQLIAVNDRLNTLDKDRDKWKEDAIYWKTKAEEAKPEELIDDIRAILETNEIWKVEDGILFSMNAFRKVSEKIYDWKDFSLKREPGYKETINLYKNKVFVLTKDISDMNKIIKGWDEKYTLQKVFNDDLTEYLKKSDKGSFWKSVKQVGTGIAIGAITAFVIDGVLK